MIKTKRNVKMKEGYNLLHTENQNNDVIKNVLQFPDNQEVLCANLIKSVKVVISLHKITHF